MVKIVLVLPANVVQIRYLQVIQDNLNLHDVQGESPYLPQNNSKDSTMQEIPFNPITMAQMVMVKKISK